MDEIVVGSISGSATELVRHLRGKFQHESYAPRTIIGPAYRLGTESRGTDNDRRHHDPPLIKNLNCDVDKEAGLMTDFSLAYGPFYQARETMIWKEIKVNAWKHVLKNTEGDEEFNTSLYLDAVRRVEIEAEALYASSSEQGIRYLEQGRRSLDSVAAYDSDDSYAPYYLDANPAAAVSNSQRIRNTGEDEFTWMMVIDGCFFLQIALLMLGGSKQLNHPTDSQLFFGQPILNRVSIIRAAASSMFVVGNQIPLVVLKELMGQSFFKNAVNGGIWEQPMDLERWVLFELLVVPALLNADGGVRGAISIPTALLLDHNPLIERQRLSRGVMGFKKPSTLPFSSWLFKRQKAQPSLIVASDLLHGLWLLMTGLDNHLEKDKDSDSISTEDCNRNYDAILPTVPSATQLKEVGIHFGYNEGTRINGIKFQKVMFNPSLVLPRIVIDFDNKVEILLNNLIQYEIMQFGESRRRVCEYLQFMRELIRSPEDAKLLAGNGVIVVDPNQEDKVPQLFENLAIPRQRTHRSLRNVRNELIKYTWPSPFKKVRDVLSIVVLLTLIQTVFSVLAYIQKK